MVVESADDRRLAIELDGDAYHGPEVWDRDMARTDRARAGGPVSSAASGGRRSCRWQDLRDTVAMLSGSIDSGGSMKNWDTLVSEGAVFKVAGAPADPQPQEG